MSESGGCGLSRLSCGWVSEGKKGDAGSNREAFGNLRNCCIEGGSSSGGISIARSAGGSSPFILPCVVLSRPTSSSLPLLPLLASLSTLARETVFCASASVVPALLLRPCVLSPIQELFMPRALPWPRSSVSRPSPLSSSDPRLASSSASDDSWSLLPPSCRLDLCNA